MSLGALWTPCAGPIFATILALVASADNLGRASILLVAYAIGAGVPMLAIAYGGQFATARVRGLAPHAERLRQGFGVVVVAAALAILLHYDVLITAWLIERVT